jgi:hypothetical protein
MGGKMKICAMRLTKPNIRKNCEFHKSCKTKREKQKVFAAVCGSEGLRICTKECNIQILVKPLTAMLSFKHLALLLHKIPGIKREPAVTVDFNNILTRTF